ncbi:hypothetical protein PHLCEN_2v359 [Hermanssonia centrifuga]|uniref:Uncharacterized protein n=1 Tax=Hermanssonia centrifuga TaxID=98765 RepID=A0A2R6S6A1_9APHY|nr:hypothetical protein PHLCEN_2v359 [Hermanssonia centrifuga]
MGLYKLPRLLLYDPRDPTSSDLEEPVINHYYWSIKGRNQTAVFTPSKRITILLVITNELHEELQDWREKTLEKFRMNTPSGDGGNIADEDHNLDIQVPDVPGPLSDEACDRIFGLVPSKRNNNTGKRPRTMSMPPSNSSSRTKAKRPSSSPMLGPDAADQVEIELDDSSDGESLPSGQSHKSRIQGNPTSRASAGGLKTAPAAQFRIQRILTDSLPTVTPPTLPCTRTPAVPPSSSIGTGSDQPGASKLSDVLAAQDKLRSQAKSLRGF